MVSAFVPVALEMGSGVSFAETVDFACGSNLTRGVV